MKTIVNDLTGEVTYEDDGQPNSMENDDYAYTLGQLDAVKELSTKTFRKIEISKIVVHKKKNDEKYGLTEYEAEINDEDLKLNFKGVYVFDKNKNNLTVDSLTLNDDLSIEERKNIDIDYLKEQLYRISMEKTQAKKIYNQSGLPVIAERAYGLFGKFNRLYVYPRHEHSIIFGGSGSGKTVSLVFPLIQTILDARENAVIHDCKLELFDAFGKKFKDAGYNVIVLNYSNPKYSHCWNPFSYPIKLWKDVLEEYKCAPQEYRKVKAKGLAKAVERFKDVAQILCYEEDNDRNSFFWKGAGRMMAGAALLLAEEGKFDCINGKGIQMMYDMNPANMERDQILRDFLGECRSIDDESSIQIKAYLDADGQARGSISSTFKQKIDIISMNDDVRYITSKSDFDLEDVFEKQTVVFVLTQDEKSQFYPLVTLFLKQLYEVGVELTRKGKYTSWPYRMNWVLEEMGILPEIKDFKNIYSAARSRGLTIYGFMQSIADMVDKYEVTGKDTILENCRLQVLVHCEKEETYKYFSDRCGVGLVWDPRANGGKGDWREKPIIPVEKMKKHEKGRIVFSPAEENPYVAKLPRYEQYSFYEKPILGYLYSKDMFGKKGITYTPDDIKWFDDMEATTLRHKFIKKHSS